MNAESSAPQTGEEFYKEVLVESYEHELKFSGFDRPELASSIIKTLTWKHSGLKECCRRKYLPWLNSTEGPLKVIKSYYS